MRETSRRRLPLHCASTNAGLEMINSGAPTTGMRSLLFKYPAMPFHPPQIDVSVNTLISLRLMAGRVSAEPSLDAPSSSDPLLGDDVYQAGPALDTADTEPLPRRASELRPISAMKQVFRARIARRRSVRRLFTRGNGSSPLLTDNSMAPIRKAKTRKGAPGSIFSRLRMRHACLFRAAQQLRSSARAPTVSRGFRLRVQTTV
ncbi:hypothetical protein Ddc_24664 [Ditylenchus destructor]|nr:hypothetical protein Ddc_24664 [Ditylenchus destructor]